MSEQYDGTQPLPKGNDLPAIQDLVVQDIARRKDFGIKKYGKPLQPFNGRNAIQDLYEELLDATMYVKQLMYEQEHPKTKLWYLAAPYSHPDQTVRKQRVKAADAAAAQLFKAGVMVFSPISHTHGIAKSGLMSFGWEQWSEYDSLMLDKCDGLILLELEGYQQSVGLAAEVDYMTGQGKPIIRVGFNSKGDLGLSTQSLERLIKGM